MEHMSHWHNQIYFMFECLIISIIVFSVKLRDSGSAWKPLLVVIATAIAALFGARLFHLIFEAEGNISNLDFVKFDGMTFNGSLICGFLSLYFLQFYFTKEKRKIYWDMVAYLTAFSYGWIRVGCFINGCCWGKLTDVPWSVKYYESPVMPWLGLPTHPVQLYDSFGSFLILLVLLLIGRLKPNTSLIKAFLFLYAILRFFTEFYRGDLIRGESVTLGMSTSQIVSIVIVLALAIKSLLSKENAKLFLMVFLGIGVSGCWMPKAPTQTSFRSTSINHNYEKYLTKKTFGPKRNLLLVTADDNIQFYFRSLSHDLNMIDSNRIEDLAWWHLQPRLSDIYNEIIRISHHQLSYNSIMKALDDLEKMDIKFDVVFLTHGMPNHLSSGIGYFISFRELSTLKLKNLNLVYMQSCYGNSLSKDWLKVGARHVISFTDLNVNYFFFSFFIKWYFPTLNVQNAYSHAVQNMNFEVGRFPYRIIAQYFVEISKKLGDKNVTLEKYSKELEAPILNSSPCCKLSD